MVRRQHTPAGERLRSFADVTAVYTMQKGEKVVSQAKIDGQTYTTSIEPQCI